MIPTEVVAIDFEYRKADLCGLAPEIRCCVFAELSTGKTIKLWVDQLGILPPLDLSNKIVLAHNWGAEISCFKALGWPDPPYPVDTMQEVDRHRVYSGHGSRRATSLKRLLSMEGLPAIEEKEGMRFLAMEERPGGKYTNQEKQELMDYCAKDAVALLQLWPSIKTRICSGLPEEAAFFWAFRRAKYVFCCADMDSAGVPVDKELFSLLVKKQPVIQAGLHKKLAAKYSCSDAVAHFQVKGLQDFIARNGIRWPVTKTGRPKLDKDTLKRMAHEAPVMREFVEIYRTIGKTKLGNLNVYGARSYSKIWPFAQSGTRNSVTKNGIFGSARWMRGLIRPAPGTGVAYLDFGREEILIQAVLAECPAYLDAYYSDDVHTVNGRNFGLIKDGMSKDDFKAARQLAKTAGFLIQYGGSSFGLAQSLGISKGEAEAIIRAYNRNYPELAKWRSRVESTAIAQRYLISPDGSILRFREGFKVKAAANFPIQATGAAILRAAQIRLRERGVTVLHPVHDAVLVEYPIEQADQVLNICKQEMVAAGKLFLDGHTLKVDIEARAEYPDRFPPGDQRIWDMVLELAGVESTPLERESTTYPPEECFLSGERVGCPPCTQ